MILLGLSSSEMAVQVASISSSPQDTKMLGQKISDAEGIIKFRDLNFKQIVNTLIDEKCVSEGSRKELERCYNRSTKPGDKAQLLEIIGWLVVENFRGSGKISGEDIDAQRGMMKSQKMVLTEYGKRKKGLFFDSRVSRYCKVDLESGKEKVKSGKAKKSELKDALVVDVSAFKLETATLFAQSRCKVTQSNTSSSSSNQGKLGDWELGKWETSPSAQSDEGKRVLEQAKFLRLIVWSQNLNSQTRDARGFAPILRDSDV